MVRNFGQNFLYCVQKIFPLFTTAFLPITDHLEMLGALLFYADCNKRGFSPKP